MMLSFNKFKGINIFYGLLLFLTFASFLPIKTLAEEIDTIPPTIKINKISVVGNENIVTGTVSDNQPETDPINLELIDTNGTNPIPLEPDGTWSVNIPVSEKLNQVSLQATDMVGNVSNIPVQRPYMTEMKLSVIAYNDKKTNTLLTKEVDLLSTEDMTRVPLNPTITISLSDDVPENFDSPIYLFDKSGMVSSVVPTKSNNQLVLTINNLSPSKTYYLLINPSLISEEYKDKTGVFQDNKGNSFYPIIKKFTTVSEVIKNTPIDEFTAEFKDQPHGYYSNNVNTCANCHSTHTGKNTALELANITDNYCMACHDGTVTAPLPEKKDTGIQSKHETQLAVDHQTKSGSCTSCHNPHLTWSAENPNLLKDHYVYTNKDNSKTDSLDVTCDSCHDGDTTSGPKDYHKESEYEVLSYKKLTTAVGQLNDYSLCIRCHNGLKATNIKQYYEGDSGHNISSIDGSNLNGNIPCADCHETHASTNLKLLKTKLGHEAQDKDAFSFTTEAWDARKEREFCLKCHNNKTALYGKKATLSTLDKFGVEIPEHTQTNETACSFCHGTGSGFIEQTRSAVHAPKKVVSEP